MPPPAFAAVMPPAALWRGAAVAFVLCELTPPLGVSLGARRMGRGSSVEPGATITGGVECALGAAAAAAAELCASVRGSALTRSPVDGTTRIPPATPSLMRANAALGALLP
jgi:hypothetical protein